MTLIIDDRGDIVKFDIYKGLSDEDVLQRTLNGQVNVQINHTTKTYKRIFLDNTITFFNIINVTLLGLVFMVGSFKNMLFMGIIITNTLIGIIQEIRSKKTLDKLSILTINQIDVMRNGEITSIPINEIVIDDILILKQGCQIPTDCQVLKGQIEVNEALLTGESDPEFKQPGNFLYSGSFVTAGKAYCQVIHVGQDNYMEKITQEAKKYKKYQSKLNQNLDRILKVISAIIIPLGLCLFAKQYFFSHLSFKNAILQTVAALLGMIPEGLILLTSMAMTLGVMRLAKKKVLVQELSCMETLARVDTLCLDKTGTITEGQLKVEEVIPLSHQDIEEVMGNLLYFLKDTNVTIEAMRSYFKSKNNFICQEVIPFSSERKYSGVIFKDQGSYFLGAEEFLFTDRQEALEKQCRQHTLQGYRVLLLAYSPKEIKDPHLDKDLIPLALIKMSDIIREDAKETLDYFDRQGVNIKIISGDDPITVSAIARRAGVKKANAYIDVSCLNSQAAIEEAVRNYTVFGRVTPKQKKKLVVALKQQGHTVAMTGDGVNDVLAFKEADVSIAMATGSDAAKNTANIILLNNQFSVMPHIVNEGRRVINNISYASSMFLIKTIFSVLLSLHSILLGHAYPFEPIHLSIIGSCAVGIPTFFLTQEANFNKVDIHFFKNVFKNAVPTAFTIVFCITLMTTLGHQLGSTSAMMTTISVLITGWNYMLALERVYSPLSAYRKFIIYTMRLIYLLCIFIGQDILGLVAVDFNALVLLVGAITFSPLFLELSNKLFDWIAQLWDKYHLENYI